MSSAQPPLSDDVHQIAPDAFRDHVRSFEFWLGAVEGYLEGTTWGHRPETPEAVLADDERENLITVLCNYCVGETTALEGAGALIRLAPNHASQVFLATQTVDEGRHLEVLMHRLGELGVADPESEIRQRASVKLVRFRQHLLDLVDGGDWEAALFAQNVVLEAMEFSVFNHHARNADPRTAEVLRGIIKDERRHIGFGENEIGRSLARTPTLQRRLRDVRRELDPLVLGSFDEILHQVGGDASERLDLSRGYLDAVERLGFA